MITESFRPSTFDDLKGQSLVKSLLHPIIANPSMSPRSLIFEGAFGTGKTSTARLLVKSLNCLNKTSNNRLCGRCSVCHSDLKNEMFYSEYDSSLVGSVDQIRNLREHLLYQMGDKYRVIVFDEAHLISRHAQNALLKEIEEVPDKIFFVFCTTEIANIIPTIRSRSLEIRFSTISEVEVRSSLQEIAKSKNIDLPDRIVDLIVLRASGHMRDAHKMLNQFMLVGEETFVANYFTTDKLWLYLLFSIVTKNKDVFAKTLDKIGTVPLAYLKSDYLRYLNGLIERYVFGTLSPDEKKLTDMLRQHALKFFKFLLDNFVIDSFDNDYKLRASFTVLFGQFGGSF